MPLPICHDLPWAELEHETEGTVSLAGYAWCLPKLWGLTIKAATRGDNEPADGSQGRSPNPLRVDQTDHPLDLVIVGDVDNDGDPRVGLDPLEGIDTALAELDAWVVAPPAPPSPGRLWTLHRPTGDYEAVVQVLGVDPGDVVEGYQLHGSVLAVAMLATMTIRLPFGKFTPVGS